MTFTLRPVDPVGDLDLIHEWVTQPRAWFWGMTDCSRDEVGEVYTYLDRSTTHHAYLVHLDDVPAAIFQTYEPAADAVGETYDVEEGDLGVHLFVAPSTVQVEGFTGRLIAHLIAASFADPAVQRIVAEPDVANTRSLARFARAGLRAADVVELPGKTAQLSFMTREEAMAGR